MPKVAKRPKQSPKYTPAPWRILDELVNQDEIAIAGGESGQEIVCGVWPHGDDRVGNATQKANAHLIAAVPEMFALLDEVGAFLYTTTTDQIPKVMQRLRVAHGACITKIKRG